MGCRTGFYLSSGGMLKNTAKLALERAFKSYECEMTDRS